MIKLLIFFISGFGRFFAVIIPAKQSFQITFLENSQMDGKTHTYDYRRGLPAMAVCYFIWGFQPLYYALDPTVDTFFLLVCRVIWAAAACLIILAAQHKLSLLARIFRDRKKLAREIPASILLLADWSIYLFAVRYGRIMEVSMGYYIMPLVMIFFGALIFREKVRAGHVAALAVVVVGIILSAEGFGGFPAVTLALSLCFAVYSALKKGLEDDSIVTTTAEILLMLPAAVLVLLIFGKRYGWLSGITFGRQLFLMGSGIVTGLPMVFFAVGVKYIPLSLTGIFQYVSPTFGLICSLILGESFSPEKLVSFAFIWLGVIIYCLCEFLQARSRPRAPGK